MIDWAITGFKPLGLKGLQPPKGSGEVVASAAWGLVRAGVGCGSWGLPLAEPAHPVLWPCQCSPKGILGLLTGTLSGIAKRWSKAPSKPHGNHIWQSLVSCVRTWVARKGPAVAGVRPGRDWQEVPWASPEAGGLSLRRFLFPCREWGAEEWDRGGGVP